MTDQVDSLAKNPEAMRYDRIYAVDARYGHRNHGRRLLSLFTHSYCVRSAIDFGCGHGEWAAGLAKAGVPRVVACDFSAVVVQTVKWPGVEAVVADLLAPPEGLGQFDLVTAFDVLEHLPEAAVPTALHNMAQLTAKLIALTVSYAPSHTKEVRDLHLTVQPETWWMQTIAKSLPGWTLRKVHTGFVLEHPGFKWRKRPARGWMASTAELARYLAGKSVALVGNATSLTMSQLGAEIDGYDVVCRCNKGLPAFPAGQGTKTHVHFTGQRVPYGDKFAPDYVVWPVPDTGHLDVALPEIMAASKLHVTEPDYAAALRAQLGARPSMGITSLAMLLRLGVKTVHLYGFDFKATPTFYNNRGAGGTHNWQAERAMVAAMVQEGQAVLHEAAVTDAVFVLGSGSKHGNVELRYALRSMAKHCAWVRKVWVVGADPGFLAPEVGYIPMEDGFQHSKDANIISKLLAAAEHAEVAERFLFCSDDQLVTLPTTIENFKPRFLRVWAEADSAWYERQKWHVNLRDTLQVFGAGAKYFQPHIWAPMEKTRFREMAAERKWRDSKACVVMSLYYNHVREPGVADFDHVFARDPAQLRRARHVAYSDSALEQPGFLPALQAMFPEPCRFERPGPALEEAAPKVATAQTAGQQTAGAKPKRTNEEIIAGTLAKIRSGVAGHLLRQAEEAEQQQGVDNGKRLLLWRGIIEQYIAATKGHDKVPGRKPCASCGQTKPGALPAAVAAPAGSAGGMAAPGTMACRMCARKHLAKARALLGEYVIAPEYQLERELGLGEMACAEDHMISVDRVTAREIRMARLMAEDGRIELAIIDHLITSML
jgi:SAM-dependent methyltransferase